MNQRWRNICGIGLTVLTVQLGGTARGQTADVAIGNLSANSYGDWKATGTAFNPGPATGDWLPKLEIENAAGNVVVSSEKEGDGPTGTLTSPEFKLERKYIAFRIGGGDYERDTCVDLLIAGKVVKRATGWRSDRLVSTSWDVSAWQGQMAQLQVVDTASGDWGHVNVAGFVQTDAPERLPVSVGPLYHEALRPQFHFTARQWTMDRLNPGMQQEGWINDLNGLIYYDGEYHLFAQRWAKCWIHAVSRDLVHWTELPPAFWEEQAGTGSQSGTCVVDYANTSGLAPDPAHPAMVAFFPRWDNRNQCIAYSLDHGRTWKYYAHNPVLEHPERDPQVFWYEPTRHWVMMLYGDSQYHILTSTNLLAWQDEHHPIKDSFECPDFFELPVDGDRAHVKWVLIQGNGNYSIGTFDGTEFKEETGRRPCDVGPNFYATQSWHNTDTGDGRRIQTAWMRGSNFPDMPFNQQISFPCELTLHTTTDGLRLFREPIAEIALLHNGEDAWTNRTLRVNETLPLEPAGELFHIRAQMAIPEGAKLTFRFRGNTVTLAPNSLRSGNRTVAVPSPVQSVEFLLDRASIETYVNAGEISSTRYVLPAEEGLSVRAEGGEVTLKSLVIYPLKSAWPDAVSQ
ncbi:MAG TPA: glycoside hydrolase family 32 protein [Dongiaceae bacterium]|nr:glycoside hydrolase family 32 protein [Dongiaceae bacterium]